MRSGVLILLFSLCIPTSQAADDPPKIERLEMMRHSFDSPLTYENNLVEWIFGGASTVSKAHVVLVPGVANRTGHFWHKAPVKTANFELEFVFHIKGPAETTSEGFALWYSYDDFASMWSDSNSTKANWNLFGFKSNFKGFAVFFSNFDREGQIHSSISFAENDGSKLWDVKAGVPSEHGVYFSPLRNTEAMVFRLSVGPLGVLGQIRLTTNPQWTDCFRLTTSSIRPGGYLGFSAVTGPDTADLQKKGDRISLERLHMFNLDVSQPGEDALSNLPNLEDVEVGDLLRRSLHSHEPLDPATEIRALNQLLYKLISEQLPREQNILKTLNSQHYLIEELTSELKALQKEMAAFTGLKQSSEVVSQMSNELQGLRNLFHSHTKGQAAMQEYLHSIEKTIGDAGDHNAALTETIKQQATFSSWMIFGVCIMIAFFAIFIWKRMRDMEKKHFL